MITSWAWILLTSFAAGCLFLLVAGLRTRSGVLQFPFLAACGAAGFLVPQAIGVLREPGLVPEDGLVKTLLMCCLCLGAIYLGWVRPAPLRWFRSAARRYPVRSMYWLGIGLLAVGMWGYLKLSSLAGGLVEAYSVEAGSQLVWRGLPVFYLFLIQYLLPGMTLCMLTALLLRAPARLVPPGVAVAIQLATVVFWGRRSVLFNLLAFLGCVLYFGKRWLPSKAVLLTLAPLAMASVFVLPAYRAHSAIGADHDRLRDLSVRGTVERAFSGNQGEFWTAVHIIQIADRQGIYQYGAGLYNYSVALFVPRMIVGDEGKEALYIKLPDPATAPNEYGFTCPTGIVITGPAAAFREFGYFGCLLFYFLARLMRYLWVRAEAGDLLAQTVYPFAVMGAVGSLTNDLSAIYGPVFMFWIPLVIGLRIAYPYPETRGRSSVARPAPVLRCE